MSWTCPHQAADNTCNVRKKICKPLALGCVLAGKYTVLEAFPRKMRKSRSLRKAHP